MIVKDTAWIERAKAEANAESVQEKTRALVTNQEAADAASIAPDAGRDVTSREAAGRWLSPQRMMAALDHLNPNFRFEVSNSDSSKMGIYIYDGESNLGTTHHGHAFICGMESGYSPEFSIRMEKNGKMSGEVRGWRTVLAMLIRKRLVSKYEAENLFKISAGRESENWHKYVN